MTIKIGLIGDYSPDVTAHSAIPIALKLAATEAECSTEEFWLPTETLEKNLRQLSEFDGVWCVPASPYKSMEGALSAIRFARERKIPFLGTCGGFQHAVIEYVRNVLGLMKADHLESNRETKMPVVTQLSCSLVEGKAVLNSKKVPVFVGFTERARSQNNITAISALTLNIRFCSKRVT